MSALEPVLESIAADVAIAAPGLARLSTGEEFAFGTPEAPVAGLTETLYARHYCRPCAAGADRDEASFPERLRAANAVPQRWETWTIAAADAAGLLLGAGGIQRRAGYGEAAAGAGGFSVGQPVRVAAPREATSTGHYAALGRPLADASGGRQVRFYWNLDPPGGAPFLLATTGRLERRRIPFQAKVPLTPAGYGRADGGVLYLNAEDFEAAADLIDEVRRELEPLLRPETPLFTRAIAPGLAFAESPPTGESFGMQRCRLLAEGLVQGFAGGRPAAEAMLARLVAYGIDPQAPERNPATFYPYRFEAMAR
jgi:hypothetical protein